MHGHRPRRKEDGVAATLFCIVVIVAASMSTVQSFSVVPHHQPQSLLDVNWPGASHRRIRTSIPQQPTNKHGRGEGTVLYLAEQPRKPSKGTGKTTQPEPIFSFSDVLKRASSSAASTGDPQKTNQKLKTKEVGAVKEEQEESEGGGLFFFAMDKDKDEKEAAIVGKPPVSRTQTPSPPRPPAPKMTTVTTKATTKEKSTAAPVNPIEQFQTAIEAKQAEVQQKARQAKEQVVEVVETTKKTMDASVSAVQQLLRDIATIPERIRAAYVRAVQFLQGIPPKVQDTAQKIAAIPNQVRTSAQETKDKVTAIPGQIEATKNDIVKNIDRTVAAVKQKVQNIIDLPDYVRQRAIDTKTALDEFLYDVKVFFQQAPPKPKPPKSPPPPVETNDNNNNNAVVAFTVWVLRGVASLTGQVVAAGAEAVAGQVKKQTPAMNNKGDDDAWIRPAVTPKGAPPRNKNGSVSKSVEDVTREAEDAIKLAEKALQSLQSKRSDDGKS
jgi:hypothetical protein